MAESRLGLKWLKGPTSTGVHGSYVAKTATLRVATCYNTKSLTIYLRCKVKVH